MACRGVRGQSAASGVPAPAREADAGGSLAAQIQALVAQPAVVRAHWGVMVTTMDGAQIFGLNEGQLFQPASNVKLFTTTAAMALLGPDKTFETKVVGKFDVVSGAVTGDLALVGGGDANFDSGDLPYISPAMRPKGVAPVPHTLRDLNGLVDPAGGKGCEVGGRRCGGGRHAVSVGALSERLVDRTMRYGDMARR